MKLQVVSNLPGEGKVLDEKTEPTIVAGNKGTVEEPKAGASWANILKKEVPVVATFGYYPLEKNATVVEPPLATLREGNEKFRSCMVGSFTKGTKSYKEVSEFAFKIWGKRGLKNVFQKDNCTYLFKFVDTRSRDDALARGTWYVGRRPMVVTCWGQKPGTDNITTMPLWIKLSNIPDSYWTVEGLSRLASVVGKPLSADALTSKLELLPFARLQVLYNLGDPMPDSILASVLDPITEERSEVKVLISYPVRPLFCSGCKSLGHTVGACPKITRIWVKKESKDEDVPKNTEGTDANGNSGRNMDSNVPTAVEVSPKEGNNSILDCEEPNEEDNGPWTEVRKRKESAISIQESPSPPRTFKNLRVVDEVDKRKAASLNCPQTSSGRLTKSQKKKLRLHKGSSSPPSNP